MTSKLSASAKAAVCIVALTGPASAGALGDPIVEAPVASIVEQGDWQGFRFGLTYGTEIGSNTYATSEGFPFIDASNVGSDDFGGFLGYDLQRGNMVYGLELQSQSRSNAVQGFATRIHKDLHSARARIGYAKGKTLFYGSIGLAQSTFDDAGTTIDMNGHVVGLGLEHKFGKNTFVGFAVDQYTLEGERLANVVTAKHTVVQIRIGVKF
ncbi:MAG: outer membrane beta-barrel protein [Cognatishimia sp.]|uniref:outer membrane protein n=1 Tax=Cognatishimia sp. TaxID=2211648 RepID=UPI003B8BD637